MRAQTVEIEGYRPIIGRMNIRDYLRARRQRRARERYAREKAQQDAVERRMSGFPKAMDRKAELARTLGSGPGSSMGGDGGGGGDG
jgi:hypothetical protein